MNYIHMLCRWFICLSMLALVSCASRPPAYQEQGWASYVADYYTSRPTASGQLYYPQAYTAAHTSLPFGTVVTVKNVMNNRTVNVTINDRYPYYQGRVINLSSAAAQHIGIPYMQMGQVLVTAKSVPQPSYGPTQPGGYSTQHPHAQSYSGSAYGSPHSQYASSPQQPSYQNRASTSKKYSPKRTQSYPPAQKQWQYTPAAPAPTAPGYSGSNASPPGLRTY